MHLLAVALMSSLLHTAFVCPVQAGDPMNLMEQFQEDVKQRHMGPAIGVDQRIVESLLEIDRRYKPMKMQLKQDMKQDLLHLQQLLRQPSPSEEQVQQILQSMIRKRQETLNLQERQLQEEMAILNPVQQGRYLLFLIGLRQQMARQARGLPMVPGAPLPPGTPQGIPVSRGGP